MKNKSYVVIGLGLFGKSVATELYENGQTVLALDNSVDNIQEIADHVSRAVAVDATNRDNLIQLGVNKFDCGIVAMTGDLAASVLITMNLKALGVPQIICKAKTKTDREVLESLGATEVIIPEHVAAEKLSRRLLTPSFIDHFEISKDHSIIEMEVPKSWVGKHVMELNVRADYHVNIIAQKHGDQLNVIIDPKAPLIAGDVLVILGPDKALAKLGRL